MVFTRNRAVLFMTILGSTSMHYAMENNAIELFTSWRRAQHLSGDFIAYSTSNYVTMKEAYQPDPYRVIQYGYLCKMDPTLYEHDGRYKLINLVKKQVGSRFSYVVNDESASDTIWMRPVTLDEAAVMLEVIQSGHAQFNDDELSEQKGIDLLHNKLSQNVIVLLSSMEDCLRSYTESLSGNVIAYTTSDPVVSPNGYVIARYSQLRCGYLCRRDGDCRNSDSYTSRYKLISLTKKEAAPMNVYVAHYINVYGDEEDTIFMRPIEPKEAVLALKAIEQDLAQFDGEGERALLALKNIADK